MKKKFLIGVLIIVSLFTLTGCGKESNGTSNGTTTKPDHKIYKYIKVTSSNGSTLITPLYAVVGESSEVGHGDDYYKPTIMLEFDSKTGNATKATFYTFFLDDEPSTEWVDKAKEKYDESSSEYKKKFTNAKTGRVNDGVTYFSCEVDVDSYVYNQYIELLMKGQDIEDYKDRIFFSRLYNYSTEPEHSEGDNFFEESLEGLRIEWSDKELKAY